MAKAVHNINAGNTNYITLIKIADCNSSGDYLDTTVYKAQYLDMAKRVVSFAESDKVPPVYATVYGTNGKSLGKAEFKLYSFALAKILVFYKSEKSDSGSGAGENGELAFTASPGRAYSLEAATSLDNPQWEKVEFLNEGSSVPVNYISVPATAGGRTPTVYLLPKRGKQAFYRVKAE